MGWYKCKICGFTQSRRRDVESHIENQHPMETLVLKTEILAGRED